MSDGGTIDPYRTPTAEPAAAKDSRSTRGVLKDIRPVGWLVISAIVLQVAVGFVVMASQKTPENVGMLVVVQTLSTVFAGVCFFVWYFMACTNLMRVYPHAPMRPVWGICCYIVPIANLICPYLEMRKVVRWTFSGSPRGVLNTTLAIWWFAFLARMLVGRAGMSDEVRLVWVIATVVSAVAIITLIVRIGFKQARFRWADSAAEQRVDMVPLSRSTDSGLPKRRAIPGSEIEDGWG